MGYWLQIHVQRQKGVWLFALVLVGFWALVALSGWSRLKPSSTAERVQLIRAADLVGVTRLRLEEDGEAGGYRPDVSVRVGFASDVSIHPRVSDRDTAPDAPEPARWITAFREGETLVLRARAPRAEARQGHRALAWIQKIELPAHFRHLHIERASIEVREPVESLAILGEQITVAGFVRELDLRSSLCGPSEHRNGPREDGLEVQAENMRAVRVQAHTGRVRLQRSEGLQRLELRLGDTVALSLDRVAALDLPPGRAALVGATDAKACADTAAMASAPGASRPLELVAAR
ncbi:hypothetical protein [Acidovorax sp. ACV01]|uniref:hypothetical protein n=1 Tax=Acidovorax sp. ACV01 TaxID=2769311 RepID=UPI00177DC467|nr:hypothetical protein [Acidovorax sp. ACV01]MBD9394532.1 hypothetical protein [Acidovorax sp. ACV01]